MSSHLSTQEFVDALEGTLREERRAHVNTCDVCSRELTDLTSVAREAHDAGVVPEPSPLFWEHFSARVSAATEAEPIRPLSWWERAWTPVMAVSAVAAVVLVAVITFKTPAQPVMPPVDALAVNDAAPALEPVVDEGAMELMVQIASSVSTEELRSARPGMDATASAIDDLTPEQQAEFIRLLKIGEQQ